MSENPFFPPRAISVSLKYVLRNYHNQSKIILDDEEDDEDEKNCQNDDFHEKEMNLSRENSIIFGEKAMNKGNDSIKKAIPLKTNLAKSQTDDQGKKCSIMKKIVEFNEKLKSIKRKKPEMNIERVSEVNQKLVKKKKNKSQKIGENIHKVLEILVRWKNLSYPKSIDKKQKNNISKGEAAKIVGVKKKTLDEYLGVTRLGIVLNFDFKEHLNKKFGFLRRFVKQSKTSNPRWTSSYNDVEEILESLKKK